MITELQAIASLLLCNPSVDQVIALLGTVSKNYTPNVIVKPYNPQFKEANVTRSLDQTTSKYINHPDLIELMPVEPPTVEALAQAFGEYQEEIPTGDGNLMQFVFRLNQYNEKYTIIMIADVDDDRAVKITLFRDKRL